MEANGGLEPRPSPGDRSGRDPGPIVCSCGGLVAVLVVLLLSGCSSDITVDSDEAAFRPAMVLDRPTCKFLTPWVQLDWKEAQTRFGYHGREDELSGEEAAQFESDLDWLGFTRLEALIAGGASRPELEKNYQEGEIDQAIRRVQEAVATSPDCREVELPRSRGHRD